MGTSDRAPALPIWGRVSTRNAYLWRPQPDFQATLPEDSGMALLACEMDEGYRVFSPFDCSSTKEALRKARVRLARDAKALERLGPQRNYRDPYRSFLFRAWVIGNGILRRTDARLYDADPTPDMMWLLFLRGIGMRAFANRKFDSIKDLVDKTRFGGRGQSSSLLPWLSDGATTPRDIRGVITNCSSSAVTTQSPPDWQSQPLANGFISAWPPSRDFIHGLMTPPHTMTASLKPPSSTALIRQRCRGCLWPKSKRESFE